MRGCRRGDSRAMGEDGRGMPRERPRQTPLLRDGSGLEAGIGKGVRSARRGRGHETENRSRFASRDQKPRAAGWRPQRLSSCRPRSPPWSCWLASCGISRARIRRRSRTIPPLPQASRPRRFRPLPPSRNRGHRRQPRLPRRLLHPSPSVPVASLPSLPPPSRQPRPPWTRSWSAHGRAPAPRSQRASIGSCSPTANTSSRSAARSPTPAQ